MSTGEQMTARSVLFGDDDPGAALSRSGNWEGVTRSLGGVPSRLSQGGRAVMERELSAALTTLLDILLGDLMLAGLRKHPALVSAARATATQPDAAELVQLASHTITSAHQPHIDVVLNGTRVATIQFELGVAFDVDSVLATVRHAKLVALHGGRCAVRLYLSCQGQQIASREARFDPALTAQLSEGIALLADDAHADSAKGQALAAGLAAVPSADSA